LVAIGAHLAVVELLDGPERVEPGAAHSAPAVVAMTATAAV